MYLIKYGCVLTADNKDGTDLDVAAFSDPVGGTTTVTVAEGDVVLEAAIDPVTSALTGKIWIVRDGSPWEDQTPNGQDPGTMMLATAPDVPYQKGGMIVFLEDNEFVSVNLSTTLALIEAATAP